jgi:ribosomal protein L7/L12
MGTEHLKDKRSGRPPGARSRLPWIRDVRWAYRSIGKPDAQPPTAFAGLLLALARDHPERFAVCLAQVDVVRLEEQRRDRGTGNAAGDTSHPAGNAPNVAAIPAPAPVPAVRVPKTGRHLVVFHELCEPSRKIEVVKALLEVTNMDLAEANRRVETTPFHIKNITREEALRIHDKLRASGALVSVQEDRSRIDPHCSQ